MNIELVFSSIAIACVLISATIAFLSFRSPRLDRLTFDVSGKLDDPKAVQASGVQSVFLRASMNARLLNFTLIGVVLIVGVIINLFQFRGRTVQSEVDVQGLLLIAGTCGLLSFIIIEVAKRVFGVRGFVQRRLIDYWLNLRLFPRFVSQHGQPLMELLELLETRAPVQLRPAQRTFDLPIEQLAAQVNAVLDDILVNKRKTVIVTCLAGSDSYDEDIDGDWQSIASRIRIGVDQMQIFVSAQWREYVQGASLWIAGVCAIFMIQFGLFSGNSAALIVICATFAGGVIAWLARDLTAVVERLRD